MHTDGFLMCLLNFFVDSRFFLKQSHTTTTPPAADILRWEAHMAGKVLVVWSGSSMTCIANLFVP